MLPPDAFKQLLNRFPLVFVMYIRTFERKLLNIVVFLVFRKHYTENWSSAVTFSSETAKYIHNSSIGSPNIIFQQFVLM